MPSNDEQFKNFMMLHFVKFFYFDIELNSYTSSYPSFPIKGQIFLLVMK